MFFFCCPGHQIQNESSLRSSYKSNTKNGFSKYMVMWVVGFGNETGKHPFRVDWSPLGQKLRVSYNGGTQTLAVKGQSAYRGIQFTLKSQRGDRIKLKASVMCTSLFSTPFVRIQYLKSSCNAFVEAFVKCSSFVYISYEKL